MAKLVFTTQEHAGQSYELILEKTTVGRADGNTLVIADASLSAMHCDILVNGPEVIVRDLGSRNGTTVNGRKLVNQQSQLKSGQIVRFGSVEARLEPIAGIEPPTLFHTSTSIAVSDRRTLMPGAWLVTAGSQSGASCRI
jgi:pSer/pThr/pTyr-binding forkhead associated (FHA) protein